MNKKNLFRESALKHMSSPEQLNQLIQVITFKTWLLMLGILILIVAIIIWLIRGSIPTYAEGDGILLPGGGSIFSAAVPDGPSRIEKILVKPGENVTKGEKVAVLSRPDLTDQIEVAKKYLNSLNDQYKKLVIIANGEIAIHHKSVLEQRQSLQDNLKNDQIKLKNSLDLLNVKIDAFKKGLQTRENVNETLAEYYNNKNAVEAYTDKWSQLNISENAFQDQWKERLRELNLKIIDANNTLNNLIARNKLSLSVFSPVNGTVTNVQGALGSILQTGSPILTIANQGKGLDALVFLPPPLGKRVKPGMRAFVVPATVQKAEYGSIYGQVVSVNSYPSTAEAIQSSLQNTALVKAFTQKDVPIVVRVNLKQDSTTISGFKWTSSKGPHQVITPGNLAKVMITIRRQAPITLVIPTMKKIMGTE